MIGFPCRVDMAGEPWVGSRDMSPWVGGHLGVAAPGWPLPLSLLGFFLPGLLFIAVLTVTPGQGLPEPLEVKQPRVIAPLFNVFQLM